MPSTTNFKDKHVSPKQRRMSKMSKSNKPNGTRNITKQKSCKPQHKNTKQSKEFNKKPNYKKEKIKENEMDTDDQNSLLAAINDQNRKKNHFKC